MKKSQYDSVAEEYEKQRPEYPEELINTLISEARINTKSQLLEIGAGTGKATEPLAQKGFQIDCMEIEPKMAEILRNKCSDQKVKVIVDDFETWEEKKGNNYDLIYSAQAFHWIDEKIKYKKCYQLLNSNGKLGLLWYFSVIESEAILNNLNIVFNKYNTGFACAGIKDSDKYFNRERSKLENSKYFKNIREYIFEGSSTVQNSSSFVERVNTTSAFACLEEETKKIVNEKLKEVIDIEGGKVSSKLVYGLYIVDKV